MEFAKKIETEPYLKTNPTYPGEEAVGPLPQPFIIENAMHTDDFLRSYFRKSFKPADVPIPTAPAPVGTSLASAKSTKHNKYEGEEPVGDLPQPLYIEAARHPPDDFRNKFRKTFKPAGAGGK